MPVHCTQCGAENLDTAQLCYSCGVPIEGKGHDGLIGQVVFGNYELVRVLGQGGMAVVYLGRHRLTEQEVAIKMLPPELAGYAEVKTRFVEEAKTLAKLEHPNIVQLYNFGEDAGRLCLVMQYAAGLTFEEMIDEKGVVPTDTAVGICLQVLDGLNHAHNHGVVHRDIKPSNIIVREDGSAKLTDFGIAKITRDNKLTQTGQTMGTVKYMAPEQVRGKGIDHRTDLYSLGVSLYEAVVGDTPFDGETQFEVMQMHLATEAPLPRDRGATVSPELQDVIMHSMIKGQDERYQTAAEFRGALVRTPEGRAFVDISQEVRFDGGSSTTAATVAGLPAPVTQKKGKGLMIAIIASLILLVGGGATLFFVLKEDKKGGGADSGGSGMGPAKPRFITPSKHKDVSAVKQALGKWKVDKGFAAPVKLHVFSGKRVDPDRVSRTYLKAQKAYARLLRDTGRSDKKLLLRPLTVVLVPQEVLKKLAWGQGRTVRYLVFDDSVKPADGALLFAEADAKGTALKNGVALHFCPPGLSGEVCEELAAKFERKAEIAFY